MDFLTDPIFTDFGRSDFIGGIDNEALDFGHLEQFIHVAVSTGANASSPSENNVDNVLATSISNSNEAICTNNHDNVASTNPNLPESPPDSGSELPFSPVDLQGLALTSRASSNNCPTVSNIESSALIDRDSILGNQHVKQQSQDLHGRLTQQQHNPSPQNQHHLYVGNNEQHTSMLATAIPLPHLHQQQMQHNDSTTVAETSASPTAINVIFGSHTRHDHHSRGHTDNLLAIDNNHQHQQQSVPHPTNGNIQSTAMNEIIEMESQTTTPYNRLIMLTAQHHQHAPSIMPSDVYMGTPAPIIESTAASILPPVRKRKLSQVDCCASMMTIKPEPGARLSPMCQQQQNINPTSPVTINLQQINVGGNHNVGSGSPLSSSLSPTGTSLSMSNDNNSLDGGSSGTPNAASFVGSNATDSSSESAPIQCIRFSPFQQHNWHTLCDQSLQELTMAHYRVDADKGFNFSVSDEAFVCQKKNHFQITCHARLQGDAKFVRTPSGLEKIKSFNLHFYGVKLEAPNQTIRVEQSQSDRSKKPFYPVPIDLQSHLVSKVTVGRLHFSETTNNNMRKKGRPNPEQRYFQLIVGLHVHTHSGHFPVVSQGSERIIVRASNPGQFESDLELCWQRGITPESIFHAGRVGINTDRPDESLVIHGNLKVSGHIIQPSDSRAKQEISELDTAVQLRNLKKIRIVRYRYEPEFALHSGLRADKDNEDEIIDTGVIAQEVREVLPDAVTEAGSIVLPSGQVIENFLLVNKDRILMENIGAVKELCKVTGSLETRIEQLEKINNRLMRMQEIERSKKKCKHLLAGDGGFMDREDELCSNRTIQMMIIILVIIMATCLAAVSTLYFVEHSKQRYIKRYDRYDISHHPFTHDPQAILVNSNLNNNNNQRNLNYNGYHTNKNGKLIIHPHTQRPPVAAAIATLPLPIHSYQMSSSIPLLDSVQQSPISLIPSVPYPSETVGIAGNSDEYGNTSNNDELLSGGIDKLALPVVLTSHLNNKTANSKNKLKWPTPSSSDAVSITTTPNESPLIDDNLNVSETSSEKIADSIPVNPDFENNSIDGTDQKPDLPRGTKHQKLVESSINQAHVANTVGEDGIRPSIGNTNQSDGRGGSSENSVLERVAGTATGVSSRKINTAREASSLSSSLTLPAATSTYFVVYKNIQSKSINDTIVSKQIVNYTVEAPSITNKSHGIDSEDSDLQNLGHNSDFTDDQNFSESITVPAVENKIDLGPIGIPDHCIRIKLEDISNCQSACFEDSNSLTTSSQNTESDIRRQQIQKQNRSSTTSGTSSLTAVSNNNTLSSHVGEFKSNSSFSKSQSVITPVMVGISTELSKYPTSKAAKCITSTNDDPEPDDQDQNERENHEEFVVAIKDKRPTHKDPKRKIESSEIQSVAMNDQQRLSSSDCSTVTPWLQGDTFNVSFGCEKICLDSGSSLNITYTIPLSKFLKDTNVELHFVSPLSLHWTVCSNKEKTKRDGVIFINPLNNGKVFQKNQNVSIFYLIIPAHGHFERLLELRSSTDSNKNLCVEQTDELNILLQYNIRIVRDCD